VIAHISATLEHGVTGPIDQPPQSDNIHGLPPKPRLKSNGLEKLFGWGLLNPYDKVIVEGMEDHPALLLNENEVGYRGDIINIEDWVRQLKGWGMVNIYDHVILAHVGRKLGQIRDDYKKEHGVF
jgi:hypothetical protein